MAGRAPRDCCGQAERQGNHREGAFASSCIYVYTRTMLIHSTICQPAQKLVTLGIVACASSCYLVRCTSCIVNAQTCAADTARHHGPASICSHYLAWQLDCAVISSQILPASLHQRQRSKIRRSSITKDDTRIHRRVRCQHGRSGAAIDRISHLECVLLSAPQRWRTPGCTAPSAHLTSVRLSSVQQCAALQSFYPLSTG